jgi:TRAP transporter 4TM/12TM fusion protein
MENRPPDSPKGQATTETLESGQVRKRVLSRFWYQFVFLSGVSMALFHLGVLWRYPVDPWIFRAFHLAFAATLVFCYYPASKRSPLSRPSILDLCMIGVGWAIVVYIISDFEELSFRTGVYPTVWDTILGVALVVILLEMTRRLMGWFLPSLALIFLAYALFGSELPGVLSHRGYSFERVISVTFSTQGIYGIPLHVSAAFAFLFIIFGAFLHASGVGDFFIKLAFALTGTRRGGPAKVAVISSALFGTISGSAVSNVVTTGTFTIPLMKRVGYKPYFAGAVEAVASTGGQIMPPVMGTAAFIMAEFTGIPYEKIIVAAALPAILYYAAVYFMLDFEALTLGLLGLPRKDLPRLGETLKKGIHLFIPLIVLVYALLVVGTSPILAAIYSMVSVVILSWVRTSTRMGPLKILTALNQGSCGVLEVAASCGSAGIIIGVLTLTGLGLKLVAAIMDVAGGMLFLILILTMLICFVLGMGMPTAPAYILTASVAGPLILNAGVPVMAAHLFIVYFSCISTITPPVALAAYAGAGIAGADPMKVGWTAVRLGIAAYIVPYIFVYAPQLLLIGTWNEVLLAIPTALIGTYALARGVQLTTAHPVERLLMLAAALCLIKPGIYTDLLGGVLLLLGFLAHRLHERKRLPALGERSAER